MTRLGRNVATRIIAGVVIAVVLSLLRASGALGATQAPAGCNVSIPAGTTVNCYFETGNVEWLTFQVRLAGTTNTAHLAVTLNGIEPGGTTKNPGGALVSASSAYGATAGTPTSCTPDLCYTRAFLVYGSTKFELRLTNTDTGAHTATANIFTPESPAVTIPEPLDVAVVSGGYPDTQAVSGTIACSNCAGGGGSGGEVQIDPSQNTVQLATPDRDRLDLVWWGAWALVGLTLALILAPWWRSAFRVTHGG